MGIGESTRITASVHQCSSAWGRFAGMGEATDGQRGAKKDEWDSTVRLSAFSAAASNAASLKVMSTRQLDGQQRRCLNV